MAITDSEFEKYHEFLLKRSFRGWLYRRFWLYPKLNGYLKGQTLDVGCGLGDFVKFRPGTVGIDINPYNIRFCQSLGLPETYLVTENWPLKKDSFDSVIFDNVIEHLEDPSSILRQITKVLRKNGRLIVGTPARKGFEFDSDHKVFYSEADLVRTIESFGYMKVDVFHTPFRSAFLEKKMRQYCIYAVFERAK